MMDVSVCLQQTQYRVESALNCIYALVLYQKSPLTTRA